MGYFKLEKVRDIKISKFSSFSMPQNQEEKQIPRYEIRFTNKNHPFMWLVCKTRAKILLSNPETSLTTLRLLPFIRGFSIFCDRLRWLDWIFLGGYLPSLSINYVAMSKDMQKELPQLYYIKMKISYDLGFIAIAVAMAT